MDIKQSIIEIAFQMIKKEGFENVSVDAICNECGITKPTFYKYIGAKDNLLTYFYDHVTGQFTDAAVKMLTADNYWEQICRGFDTILGWSREFGAELYSQLFIVNLKQNRGTFDFNSRLTEVMNFLFRKAQENGQINNSSPAKDLYISCAHLCFGYGIVWCLEKGNFNLLDDFHRALETVCDVVDEYKTALPSDTNTGYQITD